MDGNVQHRLCGVAMPEQTYLIIRGHLDDGMTFTPAQGYESPTTRARRIPASAYRLVLLDRDEDVIAQANPDVISTCVSGAFGRQPVRGVLPLRPGAIAYELRRGRQTLYRQTIGDPPAPIRDATPARDGDSIRLGWANDESLPVTFRIIADMEAGRRITVAQGIATREYRVDLAQLPVPGVGRLLIASDDGVRSTEVAVASIDVPRRPNRAYIVAPEADVRLPFGGPVSLVGCCLDMAGAPCSPEAAVWLLDGKPVARGRLTAVAGSLAPGRHELTLRHGGEGETAEATLTFEIDQPDDSYREWAELVAPFLAASPARIGH